MKQCLNCFCLLSPQQTECHHCRSKQVAYVHFQPHQDKELITLQIKVPKIEIDGKVYRLVEPLGQGSYGTVFKVVDDQVNAFALKVPFVFNELFTNSQGHRQSILKISEKYMIHEAKMIAQIQISALIKNIFAGMISTRNQGKDVSFPVLLMELAQATLKGIMEMNMMGELNLPWPEKRKIMVELIEDIIQLHQKGFVHRDLSPDNIFIVDREGQLHYVLADMGSSKATDRNLGSDSSSRLAFHDRYFDPAVLIHPNWRYDHRFDLYQLGVIITELLMGEFWAPASGADSTSDLAEMDFESDYLLRLAALELPDNLIKVLQKAVTRQLKLRFHSVVDFKEQFFFIIDQLDPIHIQHPANQLKKYIHLCHHFTFPPADVEKETVPSVIQYLGQRDIEVKNQQQIRLQFEQLSLDETRIVTPSYFSCQNLGEYVMISIDSQTLYGDIEPLLKRKMWPLPRGKKETEPVKIEGEVRAVMLVQGTYTQRGQHSLLKNHEK